MAVKIKRRLDFVKELPRANSKAGIQIKKEVINLINEDLDRGISPVKGFNRFAPYQPSTAKIKGRRRPVDLKDTGFMRSKLRAIFKRRTNSILIFFQGAKANAIAAFHNFGTDKMDARPILPAVKGMEFKERIINRINRIIDKNVRNAINKSR